jgi:ADP-ribose pyrophosphatase YjhB (NUDIX family)
MKTGYYFRGATEHCLFCVRGSLKLQTTDGLPTGYLWPRLPHSVKPDAFYDLVEKAAPARTSNCSRVALAWATGTTGATSPSARARRAAPGGRRGTLGELLRRALRALGGEGSHVAASGRASRSRRSSLKPPAGGQSTAEEAFEQSSGGETLEEAQARQLRGEHAFSPQPESPLGTDDMRSLGQWKRISEHALVDSEQEQDRLAAEQRLVKLTALEEHLDREMESAASRRSMMNDMLRRWR